MDSRRIGVLNYPGCSPVRAMLVKRAQQLWLSLAGWRLLSGQEGFLHGGEGGVFISGLWIHELVNPGSAVLPSKVPDVDGIPH